MSSLHELCGRYWVFRVFATDLLYFDKIYYCFLHYVVKAFISYLYHCLGEAFVIAEVLLLCL